MLWLIVLGVTGLLLFVIMYKPPVKTTGLEAFRAPKIEPAKPASSSAEPVAVAPPKEIDTFDFNDVFGGKRPDASRDSQPRV